MPQAVGWAFSTSASSMPVPPPERRRSCGPFPLAGDQHVRIRDAVSRPHQSIEAGRDFRVHGEILPERTAEHLVIGGSSRAHGLQQAAPRMGHAPADPVEIEAGHVRRTQQHARGFVQREDTRRRFLEQTFGDEVTEQALEGVDVGSRCRSEILDPRRTSLDVVGDLGA